MRNIKLTVAYDGTGYNGWQLQKNGITIQGVLSEQLKVLCKHDVILHGAGRTDAGVHAKGQVVNFFTDVGIPIEKFPKALGRIVPQDIVIVKAEEVPKDFHARFSATGKTYHYVIDNGEYPEIFMTRYAHYEKRKLDLIKMQKAADVIKGKHDFSSFCAANGSSKTFERDVRKLKLKQNGNLITIEISADGFLYHMVRNIVGLLLECGLGRISVERAEEILQAQNRTKAPATAPAKGLCLWEVFY